LTIGTWSAATVLPSLLVEADDNQIAGREFAVEGGDSDIAFR
jgi:hypothetical protein